MDVDDAVDEGLLTTVPTSVRRRMVAEYLRRGTRTVAEEVPVPSLPEILAQYDVSFPDDSEAEPVQLLPEEIRLTFLLKVMRSDTRNIRALGRESLMAVLAVRWVVLRMHSRAEQYGGSRPKELEKWTKDEAKAFLAAFSKEPSEGETASPSTQGGVPVPIEERNVQLVAQISAAMEALEYLVQILLLQDRVPTPLHRFSGQRFHQLLVEHLERPVMIDEKIWGACVEGLDTAFMEPPSKKRKKERRSKESTKAVQPAKGIMPTKTSTSKGGIFSLLADAAA